MIKIKTVNNNRVEKKCLKIILLRINAQLDVMKESKSPRTILPKMRRMNALSEIQKYDNIT